MPWRLLLVMDGKTRHAEVRIARLAAAQHGVVARRQLIELGLTRHGIEHRLGTGRLHRVHRSVYAAGAPRLDIHGRWMAAVLACGPDAVLSHRSAAALWAIRPTAMPQADVSLATAGGRRRRPGLILHRCVSLDAQSITTRHQIPVTTPARTLLDLAVILPRRELERAVQEAEAARLVEIDQLATRARYERAPRRRLLAILDEYALGAALTRSDLEQRFLEICRAHGLPRPRVNARVEGLEVDFLWPQAGLVVETDGHRHHGTRAAFERDRARDQRLIAAGYRVLRFTYRQVAAEPTVARTVRSALAPLSPPRSLP